MNYRMIFNTIGKVLAIEAIMTLLPLVTALFFAESVLPFVITALVAGAVGLAFIKLLPVKRTDVFSREGLITVAFTWIAVSLIGALPFVISGEIPNYIDALFETVSGFTTTGSSVVTNVEGMSRGILMWRSFTHWIGGMGVLVFVAAVTDKASDRTMNILKAEMPGPTVDKLAPKTRDTAKILYMIYIAMTVILAVMLLCGGMTVFESLVHAFGTAGTGGFGIKADSIAGYSPYIQWTIAIFMLLFGVNFNLYFILLVGKFRSFFKSQELRSYVIFTLLAIACVTVSVAGVYSNFEEALRVSVFQVASISSTTGFATADFTTWSTFAQGILFMLMFVGGCAGSTAGGFKLTRVLLLTRRIRNECKKVSHPRATTAVTFEGKVVPEETMKSVANYAALYFVSIIVLFLLTCIGSEFTVWENFTATVSCFNNIGPAFGALGPAGNFAGLGVFAKIVLIFAMLMGRLEIYPMLITFNPRTWTKK